MRKLPWAALLFATTATGLCLFAGCGSDNEDIANPNADGGDAANTDGNTDGNAITDSGATDALPGDASINENPVCAVLGQNCTTSAGCCTVNCNAATGKCAAPLIGDCRAPGVACTAPNQCCTGSCVNGSCSNKLCVPDKPTPGSCGQDGDCCSGICTAGKCASANPGQVCRTAGNPCVGAADCCSNLCNNKVCSSAVSFCTQPGEICSTNFECCTGNCAKIPGEITGTCGVPTSGGGVPSGCSPSGIVCGTGDPNAVDGGLLCDQACCSRSCGFFGSLATFKVCQPPSGCHPTGEVCRADSDCCGWAGAADAGVPVDGPVTCSKASATAEFGRCDNGGSCREPGSICKPGGDDSCSAENNCCEGFGFPSNYCNTQATQGDCCAKDALGIPRCLVKPVNCNAPPAAGSTCATSADCCGKPCVANKCSNTCVPRGNTCTTSADCCPGIACVQSPGSSVGTCGGTLLPDGGVIADAGSTDAGGNLPDGGSCTLYGQQCTGAGQCCNALPCSSGTCRYP